MGRAAAQNCAEAEGIREEGEENWSCGSNFCLGKPQP